MEPGGTPPPGPPPPPGVNPDALRPKALLYVYDPLVASRDNKPLHQVYGWLDPLQGSNIKLLEQLLDPGVFHRLAEATIWASPYSGYTSTPTPYLGPDLLRDLNERLFEELSQPRVEIGFYRRELQRNYIHVLVSGKEGETEGKHASSKDAWLAAPSRSARPSMRAFTSELAAARHLPHRATCSNDPWIRRMTSRSCVRIGDS